LHATQPILLRFGRSIGTRFSPKALLCSCALTVFTAAMWIIPEWHQMIPILLVFSLMPITGIFGAGWFLQGLEKIVGFATISLVNRLLAVPLIFALVHSPEDVIVVAAIGSGLGIISALIREKSAGIA